MEKLISMTDFILDQHKNESVNSMSFYRVLKYANFLKQPLTLGMFVPCDLDGNVLEEPDFMSGDYNDNGYGDVDKYQYKKDLKEYQEAKDRVLFEGFEITENSEGDKCILTDYSCVKLHCLDNACVEDIIKYSFKLSPTALKKTRL